MNTAPQFHHFTDFAEQWLLPTISVRLGEANRENTYTWCSRWWAHRGVAVRIACLHRAFEAQRRSTTGTSLSTYLTTHVDAHVKVILDAASGPLYRCTRQHHTPTPSLPFDPVPFGWFTPTTTPPVTQQHHDTQKPTLRYTHYTEFVQDWLLPVTAVRITANNREGHYTWCRQWWRHQAVVVRLAALHAVFEAARQTNEHSAMSTLFVRHIDPHLRVILDAANGPLHRCTPDQHVDTPGLPATPVPNAWFGPPGATTPIERAGFGPDFRALSEPVTAAETAPE